MEAQQQEPLLPDEAGFSMQEADLRILLAATTSSSSSAAEPPAPTLYAHYAVLRLFSSCVAGLPGPDPSADSGSCAGHRWWSWDLRGLVLQGGLGPVSRDVVARWLGILYSHISSQVEARWPSRLDADTRALLLFADAVGTRHAPLLDVAQRLACPPHPAASAVDATASAPFDHDPHPPLFMAVDGPVGELELRNRAYVYDSVYGGVIFFPTAACAPSGYSYTPAPNRLCRGAPGALRAAITSALEEWLFLACRLQLVPLARLLLGFARAQAALSDSAGLVDQAGVFSARVAALLPHELLLQGFLESQLQGGSEQERALVAAGYTVYTAGAASRRANCRRVADGLVAALRGGGGGGGGGGTKRRQAALLR